LGFDFPFYGKTYNSIQIHPNGVLGFGAAPYGYAIYNYQSPLPNTLGYVPAGCIAPYWCYYGGVMGLYVYQGATPEGEKYWVCTWDRIDYCSYLYMGYGPGAVVQCILYESGDIKVNIQKGYLYYGYYLTMGICNEARDIGTSYYWTSGSSYQPDGRSVLYKQYATEISDVETSPGYGPDEDIYPAMAGEGTYNHWAAMQVYSEKGLDYLDYLDMTIGPGEDEEQIVLRYDFPTNAFRKLNDPQRLVYLNDVMSTAQLNQSDPIHSMKIKFQYDFNFNWQRIDPVSIRFSLVGTGVKSDFVFLENVYKVVAKVKIVGNFSAEESRGRELMRGDWVRGGETIHFYGLTRQYANPEIPHQPPSILKIALKDRMGKYYLSGTTADLDTYVFVEPLYSEMEYRLVFINISGENDETDSTINVFYNTGFIVQIDSDNPGLAGALQILPDNKNDQPRNYDNDRDVFLSWEDAMDQSSGVVLYHISVNRDKDSAKTTMMIPKGTNTALIENLPDGLNRIYIWAEDLAGNQGNAVFTEVKIDQDGVYFGGFYPSTGIWNNNIRPTCSIFINDTLTGVDPLTIEYQLSVTGLVGLENNWNPIPDAYIAGTSLRVVVSGWFRNGKENYIQFRAKDLAGNDFESSDAYNVWIDAESPKIKMISHNEDEYHLNPYQEVRFQLEDLQSGVDANTIEYRVTTSGTTKWSSWRAYKDAESSNKPVIITLRETFRRGDRNYIQVRARDLAGNPVTTSLAFNIKINTYPVIEVVSPSSGDILYADRDIVFDATPSYDQDGDRITVSWLISDLDTQKVLGETAKVTARLEAGQYTITVIAKDRVNNEVSTSFVISVEDRIIETSDPWTIDTDGDGMVDGWELQWHTNKDVKDADVDLDGDGFTNMQEYANGTDPHFELDHPVIYEEITPEEDLGPFSSEMWPLWALVALLLIAIIVTVIIAKAKKDKAVKRIKTVRNMRRIMPSVSWDQITATAYIAPMIQGATPLSAIGPALPSGAPAMVTADSALPPAPENVVQAASQEAPAPAPAAPMPTPGVPEPAPAPPVQPAPPPVL